MASAPKSALSKITSFKFRAAPPKSDGGGAEADGPGNGKRNLDSPLFRQLSPQLQEQSQAQEHLWEYLHALPTDEIGVPDYYPRLARNLRDIEYRNLI